MPHVVVKLQSGRSEQQKAKIAEEVTKAVMTTANCAEQSVSVSIEDVEPDDWVEKVYKPDIIARADKLYKKPGYNPLWYQAAKISTHPHRHGRRRPTIHDFAVARQKDVDARPSPSWGGPMRSLLPFFGSAVPGLASCSAWLCRSTADSRRTDAFDHWQARGEYLL